MVRVLVVDGSQLMVRIVEMLVPDDVEVVQANRFADARTLLAFDPPDAAIFNLTPANLDWPRLMALCHDRDPPIPFVLCSTLDRDPADELSLCGRPVAVIRKPVEVAELRSTLGRLLHEVSVARTAES